MYWSPRKISKKLSTQNVAIDIDQNKSCVFNQIFRNVYYPTHWFTNIILPFFVDSYGSRSFNPSSVIRNLKNWLYLFSRLISWFTLSCSLCDTNCRWLNYKVTIFLVFGPVRELKDLELTFNEKTLFVVHTKHGGDPTSWILFLGVLNNLFLKPSLFYLSQNFNHLNRNFALIAVMNTSRRW